MGFELNLFICLALISVCASNELPQVKTPLGNVQGQIKSSFGGRSFAAFEGIPFAKPPTGELRFAAPQPVEPWKGTWDARHLYTCMQKLMFQEKVYGEEDCLYINVYVPENKLQKQEKLDVIVHIHGGAFMMGTSHDYCHPEYLMDRDVVYVTFNYRLAIFGFLSTADKVLPGNNGLKDQTLALKWIQENIESFGGNPKSVTLTGTSAGGASVHYHYLSPLSKGLFHRGFAQSGVALNCWALQDRPLEKAKKLSVLAGCPDSDSKSMLECLKQRPAQFLYSKLKEFYGAFDMPLAPFAPVIEKGISNAFLPEHPYFMLDQKRVLDVPFITSTTNSEGLLISTIVAHNLELLNTKWTEIAPVVLDFNYTVAKSIWASTANEIKDFFLGKGEDFRTDNIDELTKMMTERWFTFDAETAARLQSKANKSPVYYYIFNYEGSVSVSQLFAPGNNYKGVCHGDDAQYIFPNAFSNTSTPTEDELKMKEQFINMLITYAKTGIPKFEGVNWEPTKSSELTYLDISGPTDMQVRTIKELTARTFWKTVGILENQNIMLTKDEL